MAELAFRADLKLATATLAAIDAATLDLAEDGLRPHLGASLIGRPCSRALWYSFRWATKPAHEARILRLFARGHREEDNLAAIMRAASINLLQVDPATGRQFTFGSGHFGGSADGACVNLPDAPQTWHLVEMKTHSTKSFNTLEAKGVLEAKPEHWAQMQCYMAWAGLERALYVAVCKDDDRLHLERIDADKDAARALFDKAQRIINAPTPPEGISTDASWYECKFCDHRDLCHGSAAPLPTCRSCSHSTPEPGGTWSCARHSGKTLSVKEQKAGCQAHRIIPILLKNWATPVDASESDNWVTYSTKTGEFTNGAPPKGFDSTEIYDAQDKGSLALVAAQCMDLRSQFGRRVVA
jgi:hypothetical protein